MESIRIQRNTLLILHDLTFEVDVGGGLDRAGEVVVDGRAGDAGVHIHPAQQQQQHIKPPTV